MPTPDVTGLLWTCFSSLIVARTSVANARDLVHSRHHYRPWVSDPGCIQRFESRAKRTRRMMAEYLDRLQARAVGHAGGHPDVAFVGGDARALGMADGTADLLFTSPPYCSTLDYTRAHLFAVAWMADVLDISVERTACT